MCVLKHQTISRLLLDSWEKRSPKQALGGSLPHLAPPPPARAPAQSPPSILGLVSGRERRPGWLFARPPRSFHSRSAFAPFLSSTDAQPRDCASFLLPVLQGPGAGGPDTPPGRRAPALVTLVALPPPQPPTSHCDPTELAAPRAEPSGGRVGRSSSPSRTPELHAGTRRLAAGGAKLHTRRLLRPGRKGLSSAAPAGRGPKSANS